VIAALYNKRNELLREITALEARVGKLNLHIDGNLEHIKALQKELATGISFDVLQENCKYKNKKVCDKRRFFNDNCTKQNCTLIPKVKVLYSETNDSRDKLHSR
jgi:hypothetical protein